MNCTALAMAVWCEIKVVKRVAGNLRLVRTTFDYSGTARDFTEDCMTRQADSCAVMVIIVLTSKSCICVCKFSKVIGLPRFAG